MINLTTYTFLKRMIDIVLSSILLIIALPFLVIFAVILTAELHRSPFFFQDRGLTLGKNRFRILKLRTIKKIDEIELSHNITEEILLKPNLKPVLTPFAKWLRKTGLDELPQLFNVLIGHMSLVGPRPLMIRDLEILKRDSIKLYDIRSRYTTKPGLTGMWQIYGDRKRGLSNLISLEYFYELNRSPYLDLRLMLETIPIMLFAKNSDAVLYDKNLVNRKAAFSILSDTNITKESFINLARENSGKIKFVSKDNWNEVITYLMNHNLYIDRNEDQIHNAQDYEHLAN